MKMKLQDALASKTLVDDMNVTLQVRHILYTVAPNKPQKKCSDCVACRNFCNHIFNESI